MVEMVETLGGKRQSESVSGYRYSQPFSTSRLK